MVDTSRLVDFLARQSPFPYKVVFPLGAAANA